jgi:hypothetical protein
MVPIVIFVCAGKAGGAVVNFDGTTARSFGVTSSQKVDAINNGAYKVTFNRDVSNCAYVASLGDRAGNTFQGEVSATSFGDTNSVFVGTSDSSGLGIDRAFHLAVLC